MERALESLAAMRERSTRVKVSTGGNREYNPGWHTALDLRNLLTVSEAITRHALDRKESRGAHFRDDYPEKSAVRRYSTTRCRKGADDLCSWTRRPPPKPRRKNETDHRGDEVMATITMAPPAELTAGTQQIR